MTVQTTTHQSATQTKALTVLTAMAFGALFLFLTGMIPVQAVHDAAHDTRHAVGFPCH